jgi:hypothetical protein
MNTSHYIAKSVTADRIREAETARFARAGKDEKPQQPQRRIRAFRLAFAR